MPKPATILAATTRFLFLGTPTIGSTGDYCYIFSKYFSSSFIRNFGMVGSKKNLWVSIFILNVRITNDKVGKFAKRNFMTKNRFLRLRFCKKKFSGKYLIHVDSFKNKLISKLNTKFI